MNKKERLTEELLQRPSKFKWGDLVSVMKYHGFEMKNAKKRFRKTFL